MKLFQTEIRIDKTKVIKFATRRRKIGRRRSYSNKNETDLSRSLLFTPRLDYGLNKARSVNNADATALELMYTQRKRHGHVGRGININ